MKKLKKRRGGNCCGDPKAQKRSLNYGVIIFIIGYAWHISVLPGLYSFLGRDVMATLAMFPDQVETFKEKIDWSDHRTGREFAFMGAFTHTIVFLFGLVCAQLVRRALSGFLTNRPDPVSVGASLSLIVWATAIFHSFAWKFLHFCFETRFGPVFEYATLFFNEHGAETPFAWTSSISYSTALFIGLVMNLDDPIPFARPLEAVCGWISVFGVPFIVWLGTLDRVTLPFFRAMEELGVSSTSTSTTINDTSSSVVDSLTADDASFSGKSIAYVLGLIMCCAFPTTYTAVRCLASIRYEEGVPHRGIWVELVHAAFETSKTWLLSFLLSSSLLTLSLYKDFSLANGIYTVIALIEVFFQMRFLMLVLVGLVTGLMLVLVIAGVEYANQVVKGILLNVVLSKPLEWMKDMFALLCVTLLWNCYLVGFWGSFMPFQIYCFYLHQIDPKLNYTHWDAWKDGWIFVFCGSYIVPVCVQATLKITSAKLKKDWGIVQECLLAIFQLVPLSLMLDYYWSNEEPALPVIQGMTIIHFLYIATTWRGRPELTGRRFWKEFREANIWGIIQYYFDQHIIVDGSKVNTRDPKLKGNKANWQRNRSNFDWVDEAEDGPPVPRVIGFHPHGLYPCSVVWSHVTPRWRAVFGSLMPRPMTDAITHTIPFMREFLQWSGGLEVSKPVVRACLERGDTIILVPGGQGEILLHTHENFALKKMVLCARHSGFLRLALEYGAEVVPSFSFGEIQAIQNINFAPLQRLTRKILGFPLPFFPVGRFFKLLPIPIAVPFTFCLGKPIRAVCKVPGKPTEEEVENLHRIYFKALVDLFNKYKHDAGYGDWTVELNFKRQA